MNKFKAIRKIFLSFVSLITFARLVITLSTDQYLTHHWPITNGLMHDIIGDANMNSSLPIIFSPDRFGTSNSAINLSNHVFTSVPAGIYFNSPTFTISAWIYPLNIVGKWARIIDFGNGKTDNIFLSFGSNIGGLYPALSIRAGSNLITDTVSQKPLVDSQWQLLTASFDGNQTHIYINEEIAISVRVNYTSKSIVRATNYIGKSNWPEDTCYSTSLIDDIRFYNKSFNQQEMVGLMRYFSNKTSISTLLLKSIYHLNI